MLQVRPTPADGKVGRGHYWNRCRCLAPAAKRCSRRVLVGGHASLRRKRCDSRRSPFWLGGSATGLSAISGQAVSSSSADGHSNMGTLPPQSELFLQSFAPAERPPCAACSMSDCGTERTYLSTPGNVCLRRRSGQSRADSASCLRPERTLGADEHEVVLRPKTFAARLRPVERCARRHLG